MGLDITALKFLHSIEMKPLGHVITLGRQNIKVHSSIIKKILNVSSEYKYGDYCESLLLKHFGASKVDSLDFSNFEEATHIVDLNLPLPEKFHGIYDTVINFGTLQYIFNVPEALKSCSALCKKGGQILHVMPSNNFSDGGFYQFSAEFLFSLYSKTNGYTETEVFLHDTTDNNHFYKVNYPQQEQTIDIHSFNPVNILCRTISNQNSLLNLNVQQYNYLHLWNQFTNNEKCTAPLERRLSILEYLKQNNTLHKIINFMNNFLKLIGLKNKNRLGKNNKNFKVIKF
tara:strand:- start:5633 stop:6490 length:858 start_codon:yes stop_codon:yes gene_type:complete